MWPTCESHALACGSHIPGLYCGAQRRGQTAKQNSANFGEESVISRGHGNNEGSDSPRFFPGLSVGTEAANGPHDACSGNKERLVYFSCRSYFRLRMAGGVEGKDTRWDPAT